MFGVVLLLLHGREASLPLALEEKEEEREISGVEERRAVHKRVLSKMI